MRRGKPLIGQLTSLGARQIPVPLWFDYYDASRLDGFKGDSYHAGLIAQRVATA